MTGDATSEHRRHPLRYQRADLWRWRVTRPPLLATAVAALAATALAVVRLDGDPDTAAATTTIPTTVVDTPTTVVDAPTTADTPTTIVESTEVSSAPLTSPSPTMPASTAVWVTPPENLAVELTNRYGGYVLIVWSTSTEDAPPTIATWEQWDMEVDRDGFLVVQDPADQLAGFVGLENLEAGHYTVRVRRVDGRTTSPWVSTSFDVAAPGDPLPAPAITGFEVEDGSVNVTWSAPQPYLGTVSLWHLQLVDEDGGVAAEQQIIGSDVDETLSVTLGPVPPGDYTLRLQLGVTDTFTDWVERPVTVPSS